VPVLHQVKSYLDEKNIPFENIDVAGNPNGLQYMITVSGQMGVPVVMIDDYVIVGFDKDKIDAKLGI